MSSGIRHSLAIIEAVASVREGLSFTQLRHDLSLPAATLSRLTKVLMAEGWLGKNSQGFYCCAAGLVGTAESIVRNHSVIDTIGPVVTQLANETGESAAYVEWLTDRFVFRAKAEMPDSYHYLPVGKSNTDISNGFFPATLAFQAEKRVAELIRNHKRGEQIRPIVDQIRADRFFLSHDKGIRFLAPVFEKSQFVGTLGISAMPRELTETQQVSFRRAVVNAAAKATQTLSGSKGA